MFRKVIAMLVAVVCLIPSASLANDAIAFDDSEDLLSVTYKLKSKEIEIGEVIDFTLTLKNNSAETFRDFYLIDIFRDNDLDEEDIINVDYFSRDLLIRPGETAIFELSVQVTEDILWYKTENGYYADFKIDLQSSSYDNKNDEYWSYWYHDSKSTPVKIINLTDGSELMSFDSVEEPPWVFTEFDTHYMNKDYLFEFEKFVGANVATSYTLSNISSDEINDVYIHIDYFENFIVEQLEPRQSVEDTISGYAIMKKDTRASELEIRSQALFQLNGSYYCVQSVKILLIQKKLFPEFKISASRDFMQDSRYVLSVKNMTGIDFDKFYFDIPRDNDYSYDVSKLIEFSDSQILQSSISKLENLRSFVIGYVEDSILYTWKIYFDYESEGDILDIHSINALEYFNIQELTAPSPSPSPSPSRTPEPSRTPGPSRTPMPKPTRLPVNTPKPSPTLRPSPTLKPSPTQAPTPEPSSTVTVNSVRVIPAVPVWVWIALGAALLAAGIISFVLYVKRARKEED